MTIQGCKKLHAQHAVVPHKCHAVTTTYLIAATVSLAAKRVISTSQTKAETAHQVEPLHTHTMFSAVACCV